MGSHKTYVKERLLLSFEVIVRGYRSRLLLYVRSSIIRLVDARVLLLHVRPFRRRQDVKVRLKKLPSVWEPLDMPVLEPSRPMSNKVRAFGEVIYAVCIESSGASLPQVLYRSCGKCT